MAKVQLIKLTVRDMLQYMCPGCHHRHQVPTDAWEWNGNFDKPTVTPSVKHYVTHEDGSEQTICHYFIRHFVVTVITN